jgi:PAS domain S-box-containing protein
MASSPTTKILLVDDQPANLAVLEAILADVADERVAVTSGEAALREVLAHDFAVVLLDVRMPTMNGFELAELIRQHPRTQGLPIIFLTAGDADEFPLERAYALGAVDYMTKPFNPVVLPAKVSVFIDLFRKNAELARLASEQLARSEQQLDESRDQRERLVRELQAAGERMRDIFHRAPAIMCVMRGPEHVIEMANQRYRDLAGGRALHGLPLRQALPELEGQGFVGVLDQVYGAGEAVEGNNVRILLQGGDERAGLDEHFLDFVCMPLREPDGDVSGVLLHGVDVTERTRANLLAVGQRGALELAVTDAPLGDVLDVLARTAEDYSGGTALASVQLVAADGRHLRHAAAPSLPADFQRDVDAIRIGPVGGAAASAAWRCETVSSADIDSDPLWDGYRDLALAHGLRASRAVPILAPSGAVLGSFTLYYRDRRHASAQEEAAMALLANTASLVIGQRHEAAERQAAELRSRAILESMSEGFIALDAEWRITYANRAAEDVTRRRREQLVGGQFWDLFRTLRGTPEETALRRSVQTGAANRISTYDAGQGRWFEINAFPMEGGGIVLYFRDETDRRRAEEGVRRLAAVAEQSSDFIGIFTPDAGGIYLNPAGRRMAGLKSETNIAAWRMIDFFPREDRPFVLEHVMPALTGEQAAWEGELHLAQPDGRAALPVYFKGFAVRDGEGHNIGLATITRDITLQKRGEDELRRVAADLSEADHRKSEFLATLAHELRNPLAPIRTGLDLMRLAPHDRDAVARVHAMMDRQLGHLIHLVDDLLDIARITRGRIELKKQPVALQTAVAMAVESSTALVGGHGHRLQVELPPDPLELEADVTRLVQVLSNLLNNAAKYTPAGGTITLSAWREDGQAVIAVADTGIGIPQEAIGSVFEMFTQVRGSLDRAQGGLGIGLSLVRRLVELHGGRVSAFSGGTGQGSTFTVRLPLRPGTPHARAAAGADATRASAAGPLRVLVVDDNLDAAGSLAALLALLGHTVRVAHDGPEGLRVAEEFLPDLAFLDIGLPGMSGYDLARAIRRQRPLQQVVLIALTGWGAHGDQQQSHEAGFDQHLTKPVSLEALEQALGAAARALP